MKNGTPIGIRKLDPIQMPHVDINELLATWKSFIQSEWMDAVYKALGVE